MALVLARFFPLSMYSGRGRGEGAFESHSTLVLCRKNPPPMLRKPAEDMEWEMREMLARLAIQAPTSVLPRFDRLTAA
jgi:hypothetical protein